MTNTHKVFVNTNKGKRLIDTAIPSDRVKDIDNTLTRMKSDLALGYQVIRHGGFKTPSNHKNLKKQLDRIKQLKEQRLNNEEAKS